MEMIEPTTAGRPVGDLRPRGLLRATRIIGRIFCSPRAGRRADVTAAIKWLEQTGVSAEPIETSVIAKLSLPPRYPALRVNRAQYRMPILGCFGSKYGIEAGRQIESSL